MVETLEFQIRQLAEHPRRRRTPLFKELLRSETFLLTVDAPLEQAQVTRISKVDETLPVWADKDPELGGVWVPVFPSRDAVSGFVARRKLRPPRGQEFLWMGHEAGAIFPLLRGVPCFAGMRLHLDAASSVDVTWSEVRALSEGHIPSEAPELYDLPVAKLVLPSGSKLAFGIVDAGAEEPKGRLLCVPEAGHFKADDVRKLVRLPFEDGPVWMACRHFLQVLRYLQKTAGKGGRHVEDLLCSLIAFQMYGEAESLCEWIIEKGGHAYGWLALAAIYGRTSRLTECVQLCERAAKRYPNEPAFVVNQARALNKLGRRSDARDVLLKALEAHPAEKKFRQELDTL